MLSKFNFFQLRLLTLYLYISSQKDYICFDFMPRHHNIIRYRKGLAVIRDDFSTVCSWVQFPNKESWRYDLFLLRNPVPVRCPVAGKFNFTQRGEHPFRTRCVTETEYELMEF